MKHYQPYIDNLAPQDLQAFFDLIAEDAEKFLSRDKVFDSEAYERGKTALKTRRLPRTGMSFNEVVADIRANVLEGSIHQHDRSYIAFPDKGSATIAQYAGMLNSITNQNVIADEKSAP